MQDSIQNRFTPSRFTAPKPQRVADGQFFSAVLTNTGRTNRADLTWKEPYKGAAQIVAFSSDQLDAALRKLDPAIKFLVKHAGEDSASLSQEDTILENMRLDPLVTDVQYQSACARFKRAPKPRKMVFTQQALDFDAFRKAHPSLAYGGFAEQNESLILQLLDDDNLDVNPANLERAFQELSAACCLRSFDTGQPGGRIVQKYDHDNIVAMRQQARMAAVRPPENLSPVDLQAWNLIHAQFPTLDTRSQAFAKRLSSQIVEWAKINAVKEGFVEGTGEMRQRIDQIIADWGRQGKATLGVRDNNERRVWLA